MEAKELFALMDDKNAKARQPKCVASLYASRLAAIQHKLSPEEMADMMELGVIIARRSTVLIPVLRANCVEDWLVERGLGPGRPIV